MILQRQQNTSIYQRKIKKRKRKEKQHREKDRDTHLLPASPLPSTSNSPATPLPFLSIRYYDDEEWKIIRYYDDPPAPTKHLNLLLGKMMMMMKIGR
ncbi:hypothetical protein LguiB_021904 [Lonicera macranthoides]